MLRLNTPEPLTLTQRPLELTPSRPLPGMDRAIPDTIPPDLMFREPSKKQLFADARRCQNAIDHIITLPAPDECLHFIVDGRYEPCDLIPAISRLHPTHHIAQLTVTTLGLNTDNVWTIASGMDQHKIDHAEILVSHYFSSVDKTEYAYLKQEIESRGGKVSFARTHTKLMLLEMSDATCFVVEGSGNMRSSNSIEQFQLTQSRPLLEFHRSWISDYLNSLPPQ